MWLLYVALAIRYCAPGPPLVNPLLPGALIISTQQETFQGIYRYGMVLVPLVLAMADDRHDVREAIFALNLIFGTIMILAFVSNNRLAV